MPANSLQGQALLIDEVLRRDHDTTLQDYLKERRSAGDSFDSIARDLSGRIDITGFSVSFQTIRRWCSQLKVAS